MAKFEVSYTMVGGGDIEVKASSLEDAESIVNNMTTQELLDNCDFKRGLMIRDVVKIKKI